MTQALNRWLPPLTLAVWGTILLYFYLSGRISSFLHPNFRPGVLVAGIVLLLLAAAAAAGGGSECCEEDACGHSLGRFTWGKLLTFATLLLPVSLAFLASQDGFGLNAIENRGVVTDASQLTRRPENIPDLDTFLPKAEGGQVKVSVMDLLYAAQDPLLQGQLKGREVEVIGQLMEEKEANPHGNRMKLVRMYMNCCAADAKPVGALIELSAPTALPTLSWVRATGTISFPMVGGRPLTLLKVATMEPTTPPDESMLY